MPFRSSLPCPIAISAVPAPCYARAMLEQPRDLEPRQRAAQLLERHRSSVAYAIARQIQNTVPKYRTIDREAVTGNVKDVIDGVRIMLTKSDERQVMGALNVIMEIRRLSGFSVGDFLVAVLCALPVVRRFFITKSMSAELGLELYEAFESQVLPLYGRLVINFVRIAEESDTFPEGMPTIGSLLSAELPDEFSDPFFIAPVDESQDG